MEWSVNSHNI